MLRRGPPPPRGSNSFERICNPLVWSMVICNHFIHLQHYKCLHSVLSDYKSARTGGIPPPLDLSYPLSILRGSRILGRSLSTFNFQLSTFNYSLFCSTSAKIFVPFACHNGIYLYLCSVLIGADASKRRNLTVKRTDARSVGYYCKEDR